MKIFAISDPHLSFGTERKSMAVFGPEWDGHPGPMAERWRDLVSEGDLVLVAGDISWAMRLDSARPDLEFLASLPGRKVMIRGNHDYWWASRSKVRAALPDGISIVQNDALLVAGVAVGGSRLWDDPDIKYGPMALRPGEMEQEVATAAPRPPEENEKIFVRELGRLRLSLSALDAVADLKVAMVHYPPTSPALEDRRATGVIEEFGVDHCVFGHLHQLEPGSKNPLYGRRGETSYALTSCDYLEFTPLLVAEV